MPVKKVPWPVSLSIRFKKNIWLTQWTTGHVLFFGARHSDVEQLPLKRRQRAELA